MSKKTKKRQGPSGWETAGNMAMSALPYLAGGAGAGLAGYGLKRYGWDPLSPEMKRAIKVGAGTGLATWSPRAGIAAGLATYGANQAYNKVRDNVGPALNHVKDNVINPLKEGAGRVQESINGYLPPMMKPVSNREGAPVVPMGSVQAGGLSPADAGRFLYHNGKEMLGNAGATVYNWMYPNKNQQSQEPIQQQEFPQLQPNANLINYPGALPMEANNQQNEMLASGLNSANNWTQTPQQNNLDVFEQLPDLKGQLYNPNAQYSGATPGYADGGSVPQFSPEYQAYMQDEQRRAMMAQQMQQMAQQQAQRQAMQAQKRMMEQQNYGGRLLQAASQEVVPQELIKRNFQANMNPKQNMYPRFR